MSSPDDWVVEQWLTDGTDFAVIDPTVPREECNYWGLVAHGFDTREDAELWIAEERIDWLARLSHSPHYDANPKLSH